MELNLKNLGIYCFSLIVSAIFIVLVLAFRPTVLVAYPSMGSLEEIFDQLTIVRNISFSIQNSSPVIVPFKSKKVQVVNNHLIHKKTSSKHYRKITHQVIPSSSNISIVRTWDIDRLKRFNINIETDAKFQLFLVNYKPIKDRTILVKNKQIKAIRKDAKKDKADSLIIDKVKSKLSSILHRGAEVNKERDDSLVVYDYSGGEKKIEVVDDHSNKTDVEYPNQKNNIINTVNTREKITSIAAIARKDLSNNIKATIARVKLKHKVKRLAENRKKPVSNMASLNSYLSANSLALKKMTSQNLNSQHDGLFIPATIIGGRFKNIQARLDTADSLIPYSEGGFEFYYLNSHRYGVDRITVEGDDIFPLTMQFKYGEELQIPLISTSLAANLNMKERDTFILIKAAFVGQPLDIDSDYEKIIYLNEQLEPVDDGIYQLFTGVQPGLHTISYLTAKKEDVELPIITRSEVVNFVKLELGKVEQVNLAIFRHEQNEAHLVEENVNLSYFGQTISTYYTNKKISFLTPPHNSLDRIYLEMEMDRKKIYIGLSTNNSDNVVKISSDYLLDEVIDFLGEDIDTEMCIVEISKQDDIDGILVDPSFKIAYLDTNGQLYEDMGPETKSIFLIGDHQMGHSLALSKIDGSVKTLPVICAPGSYFVEVP